MLPLEASLGWLLLDWLPLDWLSGQGDLELLRKLWWLLQLLTIAWIMKMLEKQVSRWKERSADPTDPALTVALIGKSCSALLMAVNWVH